MALRVDQEFCLQCVHSEMLVMLIDMHRSGAQRRNQDGDKLENISIQIFSAMAVNEVAEGRVEGKRGQERILMSSDI